MRLALAAAFLLTVPVGQAPRPLRASDCEGAVASVNYNRSVLRPWRTHCYTPRRQK